ncbi:MFS transporter [Altererythrobacter sp. FM1]|uniref:AmpG family muropeptide MFS transporter n=1 Tax=Tsuneonella flava TaxID=2055955 RepID=UPI000C80B39B|nr:MFS transporter [Tsuneonella flava]ROT95067.1 MFS transporter [Altererythrobacter sp. FM1]
MAETISDERRSLWDSVRPYLEKESLAAFFLGVSSGFPFALLASTLTTRLAQDGIEKSTITAFTLAFFVYNLKPLWAWIIDGVRLPVIGAMGQRVSWMCVTGLLVIAAVINLALSDPKGDIYWTATSAVLLGLAGASFDIVIDAYRIETLKPYQLGTGSGMSQYGWRIGAAAAGALALVVASRMGWSVAYMVCAVFALPAMITGLVLGEPERRKVVVQKRSMDEIWHSIAGPFAEFFRRSGAWLVLAFILVHKIGDTLANLTFRLLFDDLGFSNDEIAMYDVGVGFWALIIGVFVGGIIYAKLGLKRSVLIALILMAVSNLSFALLAAAGHSNLGMAGAIGFENFASGYGGVVVVAYFSALCDLRFTAAQYALISAAASGVGRLLTGTTAGSLIEAFGYVDFYLLTTVLALPGIVLFWWMMRTGLVDAAMGTAGEVGPGDARNDPAVFD